MFNKGEELIKLCKEKNKKISEIVIEKECEITEETPQEVIDKMKYNLEVMIESSNKGLYEDIVSVSGLSGGTAKKVEYYKNNNTTIAGNFINSAMAKALSTSEINASMGKIVAAPTAGASGILPSAIISTAEKFNLTKNDMINGLFTSAAIGQIVAKNATISGAEGGCQAECGVASAMAAAAIVEMLGGDAETSLTAASLAIINIMGLVCDPIAGLVEFPCNIRNASGVVNAFISADLARAGVKSLVPFDEVVEAMYKVGKALPYSLKETALGGLAATPTGEKFKNRK